MIYDDWIRYLAAIRREVQGIEEHIAATEEEIRTHHLGIRLRALKGRRAESQATVARLEADIKSAALGIYAATGEKKPYTDVTVKMFTVLNYDSAEALDYAAQYVPQTLKLNKRAFEKVAKVLELDFVTITQEPRAQVARDLSGYLEKGENDAD